MSAILFRGARLVDGLADTSRANVDVLVVDDRVTEVSETPLPEPDLPDLRVIGLGGLTLMPGLIDAHVHASAAVEGLKMRYAETGFNLEIDLSRGNIERVETDQRLTELHLGGLGTNTKILWDRVPP